jgi:acyl dehydratase
VSSAVKVLMVETRDFAALREQIGQEIAVSDWFEISQERITRFAETTEDRQWIHVDPARAAVESPFKTTIAHGFLTLSMTSAMIRSALAFPTIRMAINYGLNKVRFIAPVPAGSRIRARFSPVAVEEIGENYQVIWGITIERDGSEKPCAIVEWIVRYYLNDR